MPEVTALDNIRSVFPSFATGQRLRYRSGFPTLRSHRSVIECAQYPPTFTRAVAARGGKARFRLHVTAMHSVTAQLRRPVTSGSAGPSPETNSRAPTARSRRLPRGRRRATDPGRVGRPAPGHRLAVSGQRSTTSSTSLGRARRSLRVSTSAAAAHSSRTAVSVHPFEGMKWSSNSSCQSASALRSDGSR